MVRATAWKTFAAAMLGLGPTPGEVRAQTPAEFYRGRNVELVIGWSPGAGYDVYARFLARYLGRHIPGNPTVVAQNMPGAASLRSANYLYNVAAKDGSVLGMIGRGTAFDPLLLANTPAQFEAAKYNWIGSMNDEVSVCVSWGEPGITKIADVYAKELIMGGSGPSADTDQHPQLMNGLLGTKFKVIPGYPGGNEINLAMQRGEVKGRCGWSWSSVKVTHSEPYRDKAFHVLLQFSMSKHADLPHIPLVTDLAKTEEQRQMFTLIVARQVMGRPVLAPPGVPPVRVAALRKAFMDTLADPEFLAEAARSKIEITPVSGERVQKLVDEIYAQPKEIARKTGALMQ